MAGPGGGARWPGQVAGPGGARRPPAWSRAPGPSIRPHPATALPEDSIRPPPSPSETGCRRRRSDGRTRRSASGRKTQGDERSSGTGRSAARGLERTLAVRLSADVPPPIQVGRSGSQTRCPEADIKLDPFDLQVTDRARGILRVPHAPDRSRVDLPREVLDLVRSAVKQVPIHENFHVSLFSNAP